MRRAARLVALWSGIAACSPAPPAPPPPDVVLIVIDTLRADRTSILPGGPGTTPRLSAWGQRGITFSQAISSASWTLPSMAAMLAGRPVAHNRSSTFPDAPLLAERFAAAGYRTVGLVANPLLTVDNGFARGFDDYTAAPTESTADLGASIHDLRAWDAEALVSRAMLELSNPSRLAPVFLYLHLMDPHIPYDPANTALAEAEPGWSADEGDGLAAFSKALNAAQVAQLSAWRRNYDGQVAFADRALGRLMTQLADHSARPTVVAVTSDHGEGLFSHLRNPDSPPENGLLGRGYDDHGEQVFEEALRVPLWLVGPGVPAGRVETRPVALYDLAGTLAMLAGLETEGGQLPLGTGDAAPTEVFGCGTRGWFLRTAARKLVVPLPDRAGSPGVHTELFAVAADRFLPETEDLSAREAALTQALTERFQRRLAERAEPPDPGVDAATLERLHALGYVR